MEQEKKSIFEKLKRAFSFYYQKAMRESGTPEYIARGWAIGMFIGCAIPMGLQLLISVPLAFLMKGSKLGAVVGTLITNHFTVFIIYPFQCWLGNRVIGGQLSFSNICRVLESLIANPTKEVLLELGTEVIVSFLLGGLVLAVILTPITYFVMYNLVVKYRKLKEWRRTHKLRKNEEPHP